MNYISKTLYSSIKVPSVSPHSVVTNIFSPELIEGSRPNLIGNLTTRAYLREHAISFFLFNGTFTRLLRNIKLKSQIINSKARPLVVVEYAEYGDVLGYLRKSRGVRDNYYSDPSVKPRTNLTSKQLLKFAWEISDGMEYLSTKKVT